MSSQFSGITTPSATGPNKHVLLRPMHMARCALSRSVACMVNKASGSCSHPAKRKNSLATLSAVRTERILCVAPLDRMAWENVSRAPGAASKAPTDLAPADNPITVIRCGSPPKAAISFFTQCRASIWSKRPLLPEEGSPGICRNPHTPNR